MNDSNDSNDLNDTIWTDVRLDDDNFRRDGHFLKSILGCVACVPNLFLIILCLSQKNLRTRVNYMVCNLMLSNIIMCIAIVVYSVVKYNDASGPKHYFGCLSLVWFVIFTGFGPTWAIILTALCRALSYSRSLYWNRVMTTFRFIELRVAHSLIDLAVVSFMLEEVRFKAASTTCTYQYMVQDSLIHFYYGITLIVLLLSAAAICLRNRMMLRRQIHKSTFFSNPNAFNYKNVAPAPLCLKPFLLITLVVLIFLFTLPRVSLLMTYYHRFWTVTSACPLVTSFILPLVFLLADEDMRFAMFTVFSCRMRNRKQIVVIYSKSELALPNNGFTDS